MAYQKIMIGKLFTECGQQVASILEDKFVTELGIASSCTWNDSRLTINSTGLNVEVYYNGGFASTCTLGDGTSITSSYGTYGNISFSAAYVFDDCVVLICTSGEDTSTRLGIMIFAKTNTNRLGYIGMGMNQNSATQQYGAPMLYVSGDDATACDCSFPAHPVDYIPYAHQVQLAPIAFRSRKDVISYTPSVCRAIMTTIPPTAMTSALKDYILGDHHYITDGYIWIKDDPV